MILPVKKCCFIITTSIFDGLNNITFDIMVSFITKNNIFYKRQEIWFYSGEEISLYDNNLFYQAHLLPDNILIDAQNKFYTSCIDLTLNEVTLFKNIDANFRNEIRRAEKEGGVFEYVEHPNQNDMLTHLALYKIFCISKKSTPSNKDRTKALFNSNNLILTKVKYAGNDIVTHSYIFDNERVRLSSSYHDVAFTNNKLRGYLNKYLHWKDILFFKSKGFSIYDFGGIDKAGNLGIAIFKKSFGGYPEQSFHFTASRGLYKQFKKIF